MSHENTVTHPPEAAFVCLDDQPYAQAHEHPRTQPTYDLLLAKLSRYAQEKAHRKPLRIGLFGGYGQGKSGVALALEKQLKQQNIVVWRLDFSDYSPQELEFGFDDLLAGHSNRFAIIYAYLILAPSAYLFCQLLINSIQDNARLVLFFIPILFGIYGWILFKPFLADLKKWCVEKINLYGFSVFIFVLVAVFLWNYPPKEYLENCGLINHVIQFIIKQNFVNYIFSHKKEFILIVYGLAAVLTWFKYAKPPCRILIIDDLDRASVDQQKSLLRAIYKYSNRMNIAVLVCMDETALLQSPATPDEPAEFLRKVIHFELRLPPREQSDILLMTLEAAQLAFRNHCNSVAGYAAEPQFIYALLRVLSLLPNTSSRRAKRLLNDTLGRVAQLQHQLDQQKKSPNQVLNLFVSDAAALLRLAGLYELAPEIRHDPLGLADCLEQNRLSDWQAYYEKLIEPGKTQNQDTDKDKAEKTKSGKPHIERLNRFFAMTRGLQPVSSWRALISTGSVQPDANQNETRRASLFSVGAAGDLAKMKAFLQDSQNFRRAFNGLAYGLDGEEWKELEKQRGNMSQEDRVDWQHHAWLVAESLLSTIGQAESRLRLYRYLEQLDPPLWADQDIIQTAFYRAWAADEDVLQLMSADRYQALLNKLIGLPDAYSLVSLLPGDKLGWDWRVYAVLFPQGSVRDVSRIRRWLQQPVTTDTAMPPSPTSLNHNVSMLVRCWPPLSNDPQTDELSTLKAEVAKIARYQRLYRFTDFPVAIKNQCWQMGGIRCMLDSNGINKVMRALLPLLHDAEHWDSACWRCFTKDTDYQFYVRTGIKHLAELTDEAWHGLAIMVACRADDAIIKAFYLENKQHRREIGNTTCLKTLLDVNTSVSDLFWKQADLDDMRLLLVESVYKALGDDWKRYLEQIITPSIRPNDYLDCRRIFLDEDIPSPPLF